MSTDVIKEFLVGLGFKVDEAGLKRFVAGIGKATKVSISLGAAAAAMASAVAVGVGKVTRKFEELYYLSQRAESSAQNINAIGYAFTQLGGNADQAKGAVSAIADFIRLLPGGESVIKGMGVETRAANGELRDTSEILLGLAQRWRGMDISQANVEAEMLGIDTATLRVLMRDTDKFFGDYKKRVNELGVDQDAAAAASARLMQRVREVTAVVVIAADGFLLKLQPALQWVSDTVTELYDRFQTWNTGTSESRKIVGAFTASVVELISALWDLVKLIWQYAGPVIMEYAKGALGVIVSVLSTLGHLIRTIAALLRGDWAGAWREAKEVAKGVLESLVGFAMTLWRTVRKVWYAVTHKGAEMPGDGSGTAPATGGAGAGAGSGGGAATGGGAAVVSIGTPIKQAFDFFRSKGWNQAQASGIVANLQSESNMRSGAVGDGGRAFGIAQWHPDRQAAFKRWAGKDIRQSTFAEQLAFVHYELTQGNERAAGTRLKGASSPRDAGAIVSRYYERPMDTAGEAAKRGALAERLFGSPALRSSAPAASVNQTTSITVSGAGSPQATAQAVADQQTQVNASLVRNVRVAAS